MNDRTDLRAREFTRILLIKPSAVGDVVHAIPVLAKLRRRYPQARIDWLLTPENAELVKGHPALSNIVYFERREFKKKGRRLAALGALLRMLREIRRARYELVIDLHGQLRSGLFALASGAPVRIGFDRPQPEKRARSTFAGEAMGNVPSRGWAGAREGSWRAYTHRIPIPTLEVHAIDRYLWVGKLLGFDDAPPEIALPVSPEAEARVDLLLADHRGQPLALLVPGAMWETKQWTVEGFAGVANELAERGFAVALLGAPGERERTQAIQTLAPRALDLCGQTGLAEMVALVRRASVAVTNDSGAMHVAAALGKPLAALFGPTNPVTVGPYGQPEAVIRLGLPCSPCNFRRLSQCPFDHACMRDLAAERVIARLRDLEEKGLLAGNTKSR